MPIRDARTLATVALVATLADVSANTCDDHGAMVRGRSRHEPQGPEGSEATDGAALSVGLEAIRSKVSGRYGRHRGRSGVHQGVRFVPRNLASWKAKLDHYCCDSPL
eukprot:scaffold50095_cov39-Tisochrysis_lutea.AAC.1